MNMNKHLISKLHVELPPFQNSPRAEDWHLRFIYTEKLKVF